MRRLLQVALSLSLVCAPSRADAREIAHLMVLKPGRSGNVISGRLTGADESVAYLLRVQAGQHLSLRLKPLSGLIAQLLIVPPAGDQIGPGADLDMDIARSGTIRIRVVRRQGTAGRFRLHVQIKKGA